MSLETYQDVIKTGREIYLSGSCNGYSDPFDVLEDFAKNQGLEEALNHIISPKSFEDFKSELETLYLHHL